MEAARARGTREACVGARVKGRLALLPQRGRRHGTTTRRAQGKGRDAPPPAIDAATGGYNARDEVEAGEEPNLAPLGTPTQVQPPPLAASAPPPASSGTPTYVWFAVGIGLTIAVQKVYGFFTGGGLQRMLMQQMMKKMGGGGGMPGGMPGGFGGPMGGGAAPPNPFGGAAGAGAPGGFPNFAQAAATTPTSTAPATNTTATTVSTPKADPPKSEEPAKAEKAEEPAKATSSTEDAAPAAATTSSSSSSSVFQDLDEGASSESTFEPKPVEEVETPPPAFDPEVMNAASAGSAGAGAQGGNGGMMDMVEQMMQDPKMQEMMYPYLPEGMRNPETFKWILSNPEMRGQMEEMLKQGMPGGMPGGMNPDMMNAMNMNEDDMKKQFESVGMSPEEVLKKIMDDPELASAFQNPRVQQAMMDCSANPMNISKYTGDKEVMDAMIKMSQLFPGMGAPQP